MIFNCYSEDKKIHLKIPLPGSFHFKEKQEYPLGGIDPTDGDCPRQSCKKECSMAAMLPEENRQDHFWQKDFGQLYNICHIFD